MSRSSDASRRSGGAFPAVGSADNAKAHELVGMAHALCDEGRAKEAEDMARWALSQAPQLPGAHVVLGRARLMQGQLREARVILEAVVLRNSAFFAAHRWLAEVLVQLGDWPAASDVLVRAEALSPGDARVAELVRQVMTAPQGARDPKAVPPPPVATEPLPQAPSARMRTYETPAITANMPEPARRPTSGTPAAVRPPTPPPRQEPPLPRQEQKAKPPRGRRSETRSLPPEAGPPGPSRMRTFFTETGVKLAFWRRLELDPRVVGLSLVAIGLFVGTVLLASWLFKPAGNGALEPVVRVGREGAEGEGTLPPVVTGSFTELARMRAKERRHQVRVGLEPTSRALLSEALLAFDYGRPLDPDSDLWADEIGEKEGAAGNEELYAARLLNRLARGDRKAAAELAASRASARASSPLIQLVEARRLERDGNLAGALAQVGDAERSPFLPLRLLRAELLLDQADAAAALPIITSVLAEAPGHEGALRLLMEAKEGLGLALATAEREEVRKMCADARRRIPTLAAVCELHEGLAKRREGQRRPAMRAALRAADRAPEDPRLLAMVAQLLGNLGAMEEAREVVARAQALADRKFPPLAWAMAGLGVARNRGTVLPEGPAPGGEARLIAARSNFVSLPHNRRALGKLGVTPVLARSDGDLRWMAEAAEARTRPAARALTRRYRAEFGRGKPANPVASYVAGTLARHTGQRPLAESLLGRSLEGHGDSCRAASLYRLSLQDRGRDPLRDVRLQRAIGKLGCGELPQD